MADAILSRGATSVTIPILETDGGLAVARDVGKPAANERDVGREDPLVIDNMSAGDSFTVVGLLHGAPAYTDAKTLAEELIKPRATTDTPLQLDLSDLPGRGTYDVAPVTESAATLTYSPGRQQMVGVQLSLSVVGSTIGGEQQAQSTLTSDAGSGVKLERDGTSVTFDTDVGLTRKVGRPQSQLLPRPADLPTFIDKNDPATDVFELSAELSGAFAASDAQTLEETIIRQRLGFETLQLHFLDNEFGLDAYDVVAKGSAALRTTFDSGETGHVGVPTLTLQAVDNQ